MADTFQRKLPTLAEKAELIRRLEAARNVPMEQVAGRLGVPFSNRAHQRCPMRAHTSDSTPSCKYYDNNTFACFGCHAGGSNLELVSGHLTLRRGHALQWLEKNFTLNREFRKLHKPLVDLTTRLRQRLRRRRAEPAESLFSPAAFKQTLDHFLDREVKGILKTRPDYLASEVQKSVDELHEVVDELWDSSSKSECLDAEDTVNHGLWVLRQFIEIYDTFPGGASEQRRSDAGGVYDSPPPGPPELNEVSDAQLRGGHKTGHPPAPDNPESLGSDELP